MKKKNKLMLGLICVMAIITVATVAVYATGKLQKTDCYTYSYFHMDWGDVDDQEAIPKNVEIKWNVTLDGKVIGERDFSLYKYLDWYLSKGDSLTYAQKNNITGGYDFATAKLEPVEFYSNRRGEFIDFKDRYYFETETKEIPVKCRAKIDGKYYDANTKEYDIEIKVSDIEDISGVAMTFSNSFAKVNNSTYRTRATGKQIEAVPIVKDKNGKTLKEGKDYTVKYSNDKRVNPGKYTVTVEGTGKYKGEITRTLVITPKPVTNVKVRHCIGTGGYDDAYVTWSKSPYATGYQVYARRPNIKNNAWYSLGTTKQLYFTKRNLYDGYKYQFKVIPYYTSEKVNYRTTGNYKTVSMQTLMKLKTPAVTKYSKGKVKVKWNNIVGESGYQISRAVKKNGTYIATTVPTTKGNYKVINSPKGTRYYKVRAYKNIFVDGKTVKVFGPWSNVRMHKLV